MLLLSLEILSGRRSKNNTKFSYNIDATVAEKLFKMLEIKNSDTQTILLTFFSIWAAGFAMKDVKS
jgi:hypothetical protein